MAASMLPHELTTSGPTDDAPAARLQRTREVMREHQIDALLVPSSDPHLSEYLPPRWQGRQWLSGFTGSAGILVVTADVAGVWTDGRYWEQAEAELAGTGIVLMKLQPGAGPAYIGWLAATLMPGRRVAVDGEVLGLATARLLQQALSARAIVLDTGTDWLDSAWPDRPGLPPAPVYEHAAPYASYSRAGKLADLRAALQAAGSDVHLMSTLDDIAWLFNLRGADVGFNPVFVAHALIDARRATLFVGAGKVAPALAARLGADGVMLAPYETWSAQLAALAPDTIVLLDPHRVTHGTRQALPAALRVVETINPTTLAKSVKSDADIVHVRAAMEQDGAALCEFFCDLEQTLSAPGYGRDGPVLTEVDIDTLLTAARARRNGFVCPSFATIAGFRSNGAIMHYCATVAAHSEIVGDGLLLIDSGGQYLGGTTDITRVMAIGALGAAERRDCTLVLKSLIALSSARFPRGIKSPLLDALARAPIWAAGIDYAHGTGHGVGYFLNVHEGPQSISVSTPPTAQTAMEPGMITSIEPGIYRPGRWGVRIENLVCNQPAAHTEFGEYLCFETLTLCPIDTRCLDLALLRDDERNWLDAYHATVRTRLAPLLKGTALAWLQVRTEALG